MLMLGACSAQPAITPNDGGPDIFSCPAGEGAAGWAALGAFVGAIDRPDEATRDRSHVDGGVLVVTGAHGGGRLILTFFASPTTGAIVVRTDAGCEPPQGLFFYLPPGAGDGGGGEWATAQLTVGDGGFDPDAGQRTSLLLTRVVTAPWLSGPLPDRSFDLVLP
jgi:hypothetical protein